MLLGRVTAATAIRARPMFPDGRLVARFSPTALAFRADDGKPEVTLRCRSSLQQLGDAGYGRLRSGGPKLGHLNAKWALLRTALTSVGRSVPGSRPGLSELLAPACSKVNSPLARFSGAIY